MAVAVHAAAMEEKTSVTEAVEKEHHPQKKKTTAIVVSRFNEPLSWIKDHCFSGLDPARFEPPVYVVYNKGDDALAPGVLAACGGGRVVERRVDNVGLEAGTILEHILRTYDNSSDGDGGLADVVFFKQGDAPGYGYLGYHKGGGHLWWGLQLRDYVTEAPLWVPTFMFSHDMDHASYRKGFVPDRTVPGSWPPGDRFVQGEADAVAASGTGPYAGARWARCSPHGAAGWTPWAPFAFDWLAHDNPRGARRLSEADLCNVWARHMPADEA